MMEGKLRKRSRNANHPSQQKWWIQNPIYAIYGTFSKIVREYLQTFTGEFRAFSTVVIDVGDFHCLKGNFKVIFLLYDHLLSNLK